MTGLHLGDKLPDDGWYEEVTIVRRRGGKSEYLGKMYRKLDSYETAQLDTMNEEHRLRPEPPPARSDKIR